MLSLANISCTSRAIDPRLAIPRTLLPICDTATLLAIGSQYRIQVPMENDATELAKLISEDLNVQGDAFDIALMSKVIRDYKEGKLEEINGWFLSVTETRQCALYSLLNS